MNRKARKPKVRHDQILVNKLTVGDARHLLKLEGGAWSPFEFAGHGAMLIAVNALTARAIVLGDAGAWHLISPMIAEYFVLLIMVAGAYLVLRHPAMKKDGISSMVLLVAFVVVLIAETAWRAYQSKTEPVSLFRRDVSWLWHWITGAQMHWPLLVALVGSVAAFPSRVSNLYEHGPPFSGVGLGCALRVVFMMFGVFLLPFILANSGNVVWAIWGVIVGSELLALWIHWDIQHRLSKWQDVDDGTVVQ